MANIKSAKKRILQTKKRRKNNMCKKSIIKTFIKKVKIAINSGKKNNALNAFLKVQPIIDRYSNKRIIHKNKAARYKSNLITKINSLKEIKN